MFTLLDPKLQSTFCDICLFPDLSYLLWPSLPGSLGLQPLLVPSQTSLYFSTSRWVAVATNIPIAFTASKEIPRTSIHWLIVARQVLQFHFTDGETEAQEIMSCLGLTADER